MAAKPGFPARLASAKLVATKRVASNPINTRAIGQIAANVAQNKALSARLREQSDALLRKGASAPNQPQGTALASAAFRTQMVQRLAREGIAHEALLAAFNTVPRHLFVDAALASQAYEDSALPIGLQQTISKPSVVARMLQLLLHAPGFDAQKPQSLRWLEIGTGCGYQAALMAQLAGRVTSIERLAGLHHKAVDNLNAWHGVDADAANTQRITLVLADGMLGHAPQAPYMGIVAAAGGEAVPEAWKQQLAVGGRIVAPVQDKGAQWLTVLDKTASGWTQSREAVVQFVPLKSGTA